MTGFYLTYGPTNGAMPVPSDERLQCTTIALDGWHIERHSLKIFESHKFFIDTPSFFFSTDGVLLNRDELLRQYDCADLAELVAMLYQQQGETFFRCFRGTFSGVFYDKEKHVMLVFMDQTGSRLLFWQETASTILISSDVLWMAAQQPEEQWDELGLYELLTYGFTPSHHTVVRGIRRLSAGCYLRIEKDRCEVLQYHRFSDQTIKRSTEEEIEGVDKLFRQAVQRVLAVNAEYDYPNIFPLSAGLDSRMATWVAHELTERPIENFTYGLPDSLDVTTARSIAGALSHTWHFQTEEGAQFMSDIDTCVQRSGMVVCYAGVAEATAAFNVIPQDRIGMILTGICGDEIVTSKLHRHSRHYQYGECALSSRLYPEQKALIPHDFSSRYASRNIFYLYAGSFERHAMGSPLAFQYYTESYTPYLDVDFLEFIFSTPASHRKNYKLYDQWVMRRYPQATQWKHNGDTIGKRIPEVYIFHRNIQLGTITQRMVWYVLKRLHIHDFYNASLRDEYASGGTPRWQQYFDDNKHYLADFGKIAQRIEEQFDSHNIQDKVQALTVMAAIKAVREARRQSVR